MSSVQTQGYGRDQQVQQSNRDKPSDMVVITNVRCFLILTLFLKKILIYL